MEELKEKLINLCNESELSLEAILFVVKDLWRDVEDTIRRVKKQQEEQKQQEQEKDESEENKE